jgi:hypothetical protein
MSQACSIEFAGLRYFGQMSASMSHEIKNALAIIQESAGLLDDITRMARPGDGLPVERLGRIADMISRQVGRADNIVKTMNRFAHSVDAESTEVDVVTLLELAGALSDRLLRLRGVRLRLQAPPTDRAAVIQSSPFLLTELIWSGLNFAADHNVGDCTFDLGAYWDAGKLHIQIAGIDHWDTLNPSLFPGPDQQAIADRLAADIVMDAGRHAIVLALPRTHAKNFTSTSTES